MLIQTTLCTGYRPRSSRPCSMIRNTTEYRILPDSECVWWRRSLSIAIDYPVRLSGLYTKCSASMPRGDWILARSSDKNAALLELLVGSVAVEPTTNKGAVVDVSSGFIAKGGQWEPSPSLARRIGQAALGGLKCKRL